MCITVSDTVMSVVEPSRTRRRVDVEAGLARGEPGPRGVERAGKAVALTVEAMGRGPSITQVKGERLCWNEIGSTRDQNT